MSDHMPSLPVCPHCGTALPEFATKVERLEAECSRLHGTNRHLKGELTKLTGGTATAKDIEELHDAWLAPRAARSGRKPALTAERQRAYKRLIDSYGKEDALKAIKQSAKTPYLVFGRWQPSGEAKDRRDDVTVIVAKGERVEQLIDAYDGQDVVVPVAPAPDAAATTPAAHRLHNVNDGWTPLNRALGALKREGGWDTARPEYDEQTLLDQRVRVLRWHSWCPCHPWAFIGLRLWEDEGRLHAECDGACAEVAILRAVFALEDKQVERAQALLAFERTASPQTLDKVVKALEIRAGESRYSIGRKMGIHDDEALGLHVDPTTVSWAA